MAERQVGTTTTTTTGRFISWFAMVYSSLVRTTPETSDEVKAVVAAEEGEEYGPDSIAVPITTDTSAPPPQEVAPNNSNLHPVIRIVQEQELGKAVIAIAVAIAMATLYAGKDKLGESAMTLILVVDSFAIAAILNGILLKDTYPELAKIVEPLGIVMVVISFYAVVALFLPAWALWTPAVCIGLILVPFAIAAWQPAPT